MNMKGLIGIFVIVLLLASGGYWVKKNYFEAGGWMVTGNQDVEEAYRLNTKGGDIRVYEFTPKGAPNMLCVAAAGSRNSMMDCFPKIRTRD